MSNKQRIFSGIQATGTPHLGNYLGAIKRWGALSDDYDCLYCVVDLHSLTVRQDPAKLRRNGRDMLAWLIALGVDPAKNTLYFQSHASTCRTGMGFELLHIHGRAKPYDAIQVKICEA